MPPRPGPCIGCGRPTACYWRPDDGDPYGSAWPLCADCQLVAHERPEIREALADLVAVTGDGSDGPVN